MLTAMIMRVLVDRLRELPRVHVEGMEIDVHEFELQPVLLER